jgi:hypothetical protein
MQKRDWEEFNCYLVLKVSSEALPEEIKSAWKKASLIHHPDRGGTEEEQKKINHAYRVLSDPIQRQEHDKYWIKNPLPGARSAGQPRPPQEKSTVHTAQSDRKAYPDKPFKGLRQRVLNQIELEKKKILEGIDDRIRNVKTELKQVLFKKRQEVLFAVFLIPILGYAANYLELQCVWLVAIYFGWKLLSSVFGVEVLNHRISILNFSPTYLDSVARKIAQESCDKDIAALQQSVSVLNRLSVLLSRQSTFNDSEEYVAQQLVAVFFLMGYKPSSYDRENRILNFLNGNKAFVVRFRHRSGAPMNIAYVEKLVSQMTLYGASKGFLFCSSNISPNAANYAKKNNISWYSLETMNSWIASVLSSDRSGPEGNILVDLIYIKTIIDSIVPIASIHHDSPSSRYTRKRYKNR